MGHSLLQRYVDDYGGVHIAEVMEELKYPEFSEPLIDAISEDMGDFLCEAALKAYRKAARLAPMAIDAQFTLANKLAHSDRLDEAFEILQSILEHKPQWMFLTPFPDFGHDFADLYNYLRRELRKNELPLLHASALTPPKKPGRNDPCPCGSGKKYKKCCGR